MSAIVLGRCAPAGEPYTLSLEESSVIVINGGAGAGKSTLAALLAFRATLAGCLVVKHEEGLREEEFLSSMESLTNTLMSGAAGRPVMVIFDDASAYPLLWSSFDSTIEALAATAAVHGQPLHFIFGSGAVQGPGAGLTVTHAFQLGADHLQTCRRLNLDSVVVEQKDHRRRPVLLTAGNESCWLKEIDFPEVYSTLRSLELVP